jgi:hypothetical protein
VSGDNERGKQDEGRKFIPGFEKMEFVVFAWMTLNGEA